MSFKRAFFPFLFVLVSVGFAAAEELHITNFGGVNNYLDPMMIADGDAQMAKNVITDEGDLRTIPGNILYSVVGVSSISYLGEFIDSGGEHNLISKSSSSIYSGTTQIQNFLVDRDIDMAVAFNTAFFVDGATADAFWYNGTSTGAVTGFESCKYIEFYENRLACISMSTESAKIKFSAYNSSTSWDVTASKDSGAVKYFDKDDGFGISCAKSTPFGLFLGKGKSTQFIKGSDNETFHQVSLSVDIGCVEDRMVQMVDGELIWLSQDGWYAYDGASLRPISLELRGTTRYIKQSLSGDSSLTVNTQSAWSAGASTGPVWDYAITPGSIKAVSYNSGVSTDCAAVITTPPQNGGFETGNFTGWTGVADGSSYDFPVYAYEGSHLVGKRLGAYWMNANQWPDAAAGFVNVAIIGGAGYGTLRASSTVTYPGVGAGDYGCTDLNFTGITPGSVKIKMNWGDTGGSTVTSSGFTTGGDIPTIRLCVNTHNTFTFDVYEATATVFTSTFSRVFDIGLTTVPSVTQAVQGTNVTVLPYYSSDNVTFSSGVAANRYLKYRVQFSSGVDISSFTHVVFSVLSTSTYYSDVLNVSADITAWKYFTVADTASVGVTPSFQVRTATYAFADNHPDLAWVSQTKNGLITASTNPYVQFSIDPNVQASTNSYTANSVNIGYTTGVLSPRGGSVVADHRYIATVSTMSSAQNGVTLIWQKNKKWTMSEDVSYGALSLFNGKPIAGDGTKTGKIWNILEESAYSFDGASIDSYWVTKNYSFGAINNHKVISRLWLTATNSGMTQYGVAWQADRNGVWHSTNTNLSGSDFVIREVEGLFDDAGIGRQFAFRFSGDELDRYFRMKLFSVYYTVNPLIR